MAQKLNRFEKKHSTKNKKHMDSEKLNIALYLIAKTISLLGTNVYSFALSLYILKVTGSGTSFALNVLISMLPRVLLGPIAGIIADRFNRKKLTITFDLLSGLIVFSLLALSLTFGLKVYLIYITGFILSTINVFYDTSLTSALPSLVSDKNLTKINSYSSASMSVSGILAPVIAGMIFGLVPIYVFLVINGISFIFSSGSELFINFSFNLKKVAESNAPISFDHIKSDFKEGLSFVKNQKFISSLLKCVLLINFFLSASISVVYPFIINKVLKMSPAQYGSFQAYYFIGMLIASIVLANGKENTNLRKTLTLGLSIIGILLVLMGTQTISCDIFSHKVVLYFYNMLIMLSLGISLMVINTPMLVTMQRLTPDNLLGRITGLIGTLTGGIAPLGVVLFGLLVDKVNIFILLMISGAIIIMSAASIYRNKEISYTSK